MVNRIITRVTFNVKSWIRNCVYCYEFFQIWSLKRSQQERRRITICICAVRKGNVSPHPRIMARARAAFQQNSTQNGSQVWPQWRNHLASHCNPALQKRGRWKCRKGQWTTPRQTSASSRIMHGIPAAPYEHKHSRQDHTLQQNVWWWSLMAGLRSSANKCNIIKKSRIP